VIIFIVVAQDWLQPTLAYRLEGSLEQNGRERRLARTRRRTTDRCVNGHESVFELFERGEAVVLQEFPHLMTGLGAVNALRRGAAAAPAAHRW
jgi:hypothetical protein